MHIVLAGADYEENLGVGMIGAAAAAAGHQVTVVPFNEGPETETVARRILAIRPEVVGLSIQFQHRAFDFMRLSRLLRDGGFTGHICCGGQFPSLAWRECLTEGHGVDTVVMHEGEQTVVELLSALAEGRPLHEVAGLALLTDDGAPARTAGRRLGDLDAMPFPMRYRAHSRHHGIPFIPVMGGRGCWGRCRFCSISTYFREAREHGGGRTLRYRSPDSVAQEIALLAHASGGRCIACFHDDNLLMPRPADSLARMRAIRGRLDDYGVGTVGFVGKCRPDTLDADLARALRELGVIRLYVGVENASDAGAEHLRRGTQTDAVRRALDACRDAGIFVCYNLLLFEPDATLDQVRDNIAFIRDHASVPVNFCRAEPYHHTPLQRDMEAEGRLGGSYLGYDYRIADDDTEMLFRVCSAVFRERNFDANGVANRSMGLGYAAKVLETFYEDPHGRFAQLAARAEALTREVTTSTAGFLDQALGLVERRRSDDSLARRAALLGLAVAEEDQRLHLRLDDLVGDMGGFAAGAYTPPAPVPTEGWRAAARHLAVGASLAVWATAQGCGSSHSVDPAPVDAGVDAGDTGVCCVVDALPMDSGVDAGGPVDRLPPDASVVDALPPDAAVVDALPPDAAVADPLPADASASLLEAAPGTRLALIDQWRSTSPRGAVRSRDLPLFDPPRVSLRAEPAGGALRVCLEGGPEAIRTRWHTGGTIEGEGREVLWTPAGPEDHVRVAVRSQGGVAVVSLRAADARS